MTASIGPFDPGARRPSGAHPVVEEEHPVFLQHKHPNYVGIFVILLIFTILEVWVTTPIAGIELPLGPAMVPALLILAVLKFATIAGYYMHLRFDGRAFSALFIVGLLLAFGMLFTLLALFTAHDRLPFDAAAAREAGVLSGGEKSGTPAAGTPAAGTSTSSSTAR